MNATETTTAAALPHHTGRVSGCVQVGAARLVIESIEGGRIHYRVEADIVSHWGSRPMPGAVWTYTRGISPHSEAELRDQVATCYGVGSDQGALLGYRGPMAGFPYRSALSDAQVKWLRSREIEINGTGAAIMLRRGSRVAEVYADGRGARLVERVDGTLVQGPDRDEQTVPARTAIEWLLAA